jgi:hypothetical protein
MPRCCLHYPSGRRAEGHSAILLVGSENRRNRGHSGGPAPLWTRRAALAWSAILPVHEKMGPEQSCCELPFALVVLLRSHSLGRHFCSDTLARGECVDLGDAVLIVFKQNLVIDPVCRRRLASPPDLAGPRHCELLVRAGVIWFDLTWPQVLLIFLQLKKDFESINALRLRLVSCLRSSCLICSFHWTIFNGLQLSAFNQRS